MTHIRVAQVEDAGRIADLHTQSWRETYQGILPPQYLGETIAEERMTYWQQTMSDLSQDDFVLLLEEGSQCLGFVCVLQQREAGHDALIDNLHIQPGQTGQGLGRKLLAAAVERLIELKANTVCLWVFDDNRPTVQFYKRLGGKADRHGIDEFAGADAPHSRYYWDDLKLLRDTCRNT